MTDETFVSLLTTMLSVRRCVEKAEKFLTEARDVERAQAEVGAAINCIDKAIAELPRDMREIMLDHIKNPQGNKPSGSTIG